MADFEKLHQDIDRAQHAELFKSNPLFVELFGDGERNHLGEIEGRILRRLKVSVTDREREDLMAMLRVIDLIKGAVDDYLDTGRIAVKELQNKKRWRAAS